MKPTKRSVDQLLEFVKQYKYVSKLPVLSCKRCQAPISFAEVDPTTPIFCEDCVGLALDYLVGEATLDELYNGE